QTFQFSIKAKPAYLAGFFFRFDSGGGSGFGFAFFGSGGVFSIFRRTSSGSGSFSLSSRLSFIAARTVAGYLACRSGSKHFQVGRLALTHSRRTCLSRGIQFRWLKQYEERPLVSRPRTASKDGGPFLR